MIVPKIHPGTRVSLSSEIRLLDKPTCENVKNLYGDFGLDIFEHKANPSILSKSEKKQLFFKRMITWLVGGMVPIEYKEGDTLSQVVLKYVINNKSGLLEDIKTKFGERGVEELRGLSLIGYVNI